MTTPVFVKEMKAMRVVIQPSRYSNGYKTVQEFYNLSLPHFVAEVRNLENYNFVAISCFPTNLYNEKVKHTYIEYVRSNIKDDETKVYFDNIYEGHVYTCIEFIHNVIKILNIIPKNCTFLTGAMNAHILYDEWCKDNFIDEKINIITLNAWERHISYTSNTALLNDHQLIVEKKEKIFLCFNRIFRVHRLVLLCLLYSKDLVKRGFYSFFPYCTYRKYSVDDQPNLSLLKTFLSEELENKVVSEYNKNKSQMPLILNNADASNYNYVVESDLDYYKNSYFSLVTETFFFHRIAREFDESAVFFSEKIFKPIICKHPFLLVSRPKSLSYLRKIGYKTFHPFIDESYDDIEDDQERLVFIVNEVERLSKKTDEEWIDWLANVKNIVDHNYKVLTSKTRDDHRFTPTQDNTSNTHI